MYINYVIVRMEMDSKIEFRKPKKEDAKQIVNLIKIGGTLDLNSEYLYLLQTTHFKNTCCVAVCDEQIIGFVSGYMIPHEKNKLFIWQVAVCSQYRGQNLAMQIILHILKNVTADYIISTVSPSNHSSKRVFEKLAQFLSTSLMTEVLFDLDDFIQAHEEEVQYTIGPITSKERIQYENI